MNKQQKTYTAFIESICKKFNRPEMAPALEEGFRAFCEADATVNENGITIEHLGDINVILDPTDNDGKGDNVAALKFYYNGNLVGREYIFIGKNENEEYDCGNYFHWKGIETLDSKNRVHGLGGIDTSIIKNSKWFKENVNKLAGEEAAETERKKEHQHRYETDPQYRRQCRKETVDWYKKFLGR